MSAHISLLSLQPLMHLVISPSITLRPRDNMHMNVRHALTGRFTILHGYIERVCVVDALERALHTRDSLEEVCDLGCAQVGEVRAHF
jgi:hypothetical protein